MPRVQASSNIKLALSEIESSPVPTKNLTPNQVSRSPNLWQTQAPNYKGAANFKVRVRIGEGAVGEVYQVVHKQTQELYALKRVSKIQASMVSAQPVSDRR